MLFYRFQRRRPNDGDRDPCRPSLVDCDFTSLVADANLSVQHPVDGYRMGALV
jgi:hypothetical protein